MHVERQLADQAFQFFVLALELIVFQDRHHLVTTVLAQPIIDSLVADRILLRQFRHPLASTHLAQDLVFDFLWNSPFQLTLFIAVFLRLLSYYMGYRSEDENPNKALRDFYPYAIVVTQDCDLEQDYAARYRRTAGAHRLLTNILFCEVEEADIIRYGNEDKYSDKNIPEDKKARSKTITTDPWKIIRQNKDERFHYLSKVEVHEDALNKGIPHMGVEFKRYFTIDTREVYYQIKNLGAERRCVLKSPYLEHFSVRFHYYHYRVALPKDHVWK